MPNTYDEFRHHEDLGGIEMFPDNTEELGAKRNGLGPVGADSETDVQKPKPAK